MRRAVDLRAIDLRAPLLGRHGRLVVGTLCAWEVVALPPGSPLPTVSEVVKRAPVVGVVLLVMLTHHWFVER